MNLSKTSFKIYLVLCTQRAIHMRVIKNMKTILIADEDVAARTLVGFMFIDIDYRVVATSSGADAISKAREIKPDVVMADVSLSDKDGYEVSREIKNNLLLKDTPVILLTSSLGTFDETRAAEACADDFILKPFKFDEIIKKVEFFISQNKGKKMGSTDAMLVLLIILIAVTLILYQGINNINLTKAESKPMPLAEREKKIVMTVNNNNEEPLRVKEEKLEVKDAVALETEKDRKKQITKISNPTKLPKIILVKEAKKKRVERK